MVSFGVGLSLLTVFWMAKSAAFAALIEAVASLFAKIGSKISLAETKAVLFRKPVRVTSVVI